MGNMQKYSNWLIYSGLKGEKLVSTCFKGYPKNKNRQLSTYEHGRLQDLRNWNDSFFFQNSLEYITWWTRCVGNQSCTKVDLILKCKHIDFKRHTLSFIDEEQNNYELTLKVKPNKILNKVIKLRCVNVKISDKGPRKIKLTKLSSCLIVPNFFYDFRRFEKVQGGNKSLTKQHSKLKKSHNFLKRYNLGEALSGNKTVITAYRNTLNAKKVISVSQLKRNFNKAKDHLNEKFLVQGYIMGFVETKPNKVIMKLEHSSKKILALSAKEKKKETYSVIYSLILMIRDSKMKKDDHLTVYLTTENGDNNLFKTWDILPAFNDMKAWNKVGKKELG